MRGLGLGLRGWNGKVRRSTRAAHRRLLVLGGAAGRSPQRVATFWWDAQANFGDQLNLAVLHRLGIDPRWAPAEEAALIPIGSLLEHVPSGYRGAIWGSGMIYDRPRRLPHATLLALRGELTWSNLSQPVGPVLGDPGLLAQLTYGPVEATREPYVALVPHLTHRKSPEVARLRDRLGANLAVVDVTRPPRDVVRVIAGSSAVISTSLHGLVVADSYGKPAAWWQPAPSLTGGTFKFRDYESVVSPRHGRQRVVDGRMSIKDLHELCAVADLSAVDNAVSGLQRVFKEHFGSPGGSAGLPT